MPGMLAFCSVSASHLSIFLAGLGYGRKKMQVVVTYLVKIGKDMGSKTRAQLFKTTVLLTSFRNHFLLDALHTRSKFANFFNAKPFVVTTYAQKVLF